jgi:hypothetical protein
LCRKKKGKRENGDRARKVLRDKGICTSIVGTRKEQWSKDKEGTVELGQGRNSGVRTRKEQWSEDKEGTVELGQGRNSGVRTRKEQWS